MLLGCLQKAKEENNRSNLQQLLLHHRTFQIPGRTKRPSPPPGRSTVTRHNLHLESDANQLAYPLPQLPEQKDDRDKEESVVAWYNTPGDIASERRGDDDGAERSDDGAERGRRRSRNSRGRRHKTTERGRKPTYCTVSHPSRRSSFPRPPHPSRSTPGAASLTPLSGGSAASLQTG